MFGLNWMLSRVFQSQITTNLVRTQPQAAWAAPVKYFSSREPLDDKGFGADLTLGEQKLITKLKTEFPKASHLEVSDISGGCGAMYQISIITPEFTGKRKIQQHQMVNKVLAEEIKSMHGLQLNTSEPDAL